jgi:hypothetical protein
VEPLVVFTHPQVDLSLQAPTLPVLRAIEVEPFIRAQPQRLAQAEYAAIVAWLCGLRPTKR